MTQHELENADAPSSPEDGSNFRRSLQIDMKGLVGDAVGNMSISPGSRDVVLAARKGLFIIDLEAPLNVPRFLPQGGTWDVADVQWNPHRSRMEYIVSTSSEKLLIWNLYLSGKTSIEFILRSHYRAITDINWHTTDPDVVVSTGIDSWLWAWDLRTPQKPVMGLCAFNAGGTQVKWNRQDGNILASAHANEVLIWDRRKGSLPVSQIQAHSAKIYGIDWAHTRRNELVTCSLDKTLKVWDVQRPANDTGEHQPTLTIRTAYPVWRARDLPFGHGVLSLPQRGETALDMWAPENPYEPVERFEGHADVVKEFVWRKGEDGQFQLITWSKDRTLRFWPIDTEVMEKVGTASSPATPAIPPSSTPPDVIRTFRVPPAASDLPPALSAPVGHRAILAEVRAYQPLRAAAKRHAPDTASTRAASKAPVKPHASTSGVATGASGSGIEAEGEKSREMDKSREKGTAGAGTMSRGYAGGRGAPITTLMWLSSVKVGKRDDSAGAASGGESVPASRLNSRSRPPSLDGPSGSGVGAVEGGRSASRERGEEEEAGQTLQEEITYVVNKLSASKVKLEKADLTKKRMATFGLHGPWGDHTSVFIRIAFTFPREYPHAGAPQVELERNPLVSLKNHVAILRRLHALRARRPCLEACLRFLLFADERAGEGGALGVGMGAEESSSEDEEAVPVGIGRRGREGVLSFVRGDKNLAEPRTSQGVFGPNGELVCFFRAPPRIVRNAPHDLSASTDPPAPAPRLFWSPALLSDAVRRLALAAHDREVEGLVADARRTDDARSILRIMAGLFAFPHAPLGGAPTAVSGSTGGGIGVAGKSGRRVSDSRSGGGGGGGAGVQGDDAQREYALLNQRRSKVYIKDAAGVVGADVRAAAAYVWPGARSVGGASTSGGGGARENGSGNEKGGGGARGGARGGGTDAIGACRANAAAARALGRADHERAFGMLEVLVMDAVKGGAAGERDVRGLGWGDGRDARALALAAPCHPLTLGIMNKLYTELCASKDIQMLAMVAVVLLRLSADLRSPDATPPTRGDYFSFKRAASGGGSGARQSPHSPLWARLTPSPSPTVALAGGALTSPASSRGSWSSLFNAGSMRRFIAASKTSGVPVSGVPVRARYSPQTPQSPQVREFKPGSGGVVSGGGEGGSGSGGRVTRSWSEATDAPKGGVAFPTAGLGHAYAPALGHGHARRPTFSQVVSAGTPGDERKRVVVELAPQGRLQRAMFRLMPRMRRQLEAHIWAYADMLLAWCLPQKRAELLEAARGEFGLGALHPVLSSMLSSSPIGVVRVCTNCKEEVKDGLEFCACGTRPAVSRCGVCRLPIKGLSHTCLACLHVSHIACWRARRDIWCATGCGCSCGELVDGVYNGAEVQSPGAYVQ